MNERAIARGLAWFGIGLGLAELLAPRHVAEAAGLEGYEGTIRVFGIREIASGVVMLASGDPERWLGLRVAGDALDGGLLSLGLSRSNPKRRSTVMAMAAVAPVVALDIAYWLKARHRAA